MSTKKISLPEDTRGGFVDLAGDTVALKATKNASIAASASITLQAGTTYLEVTAHSGAVLCKWGGAASDATDGFHYLIPEGQTRHLPVPDGQSVFHFIAKDTGAAIYVTEF